MESTRPCSRIQTDKGHTQIKIPGLLPSDSAFTPALTLFHEENEEVSSSDECNKSEFETVTTNLVVNLPARKKKGSKRKLELEFENLSQTTPKSSSENFRQLQSFWESKSGGKCANKLKASEVSEHNDVLLKPLEVFESPIDRFSKRHKEPKSSGQIPATPAKQLAQDYVKFIDSVKKDNIPIPESVVDESPSSNINQFPIDSESQDVCPTFVYEFSDNDTPLERMTLMDFRTLKCETPMKVASNREVVSPIVFDSRKFKVIHAKKTPYKNDRPVSNPTSNTLQRDQLNLTNLSQSPMTSTCDDSDIMPPPSSIPRGLSAKIFNTPSQRNSPKWTKSTEKIQQLELRSEPEYSPKDLTPTAPTTGVKRKRASKKRLLSLDVHSYSQLFSPSSELDSAKENLRDSMDVHNGSRDKASVSVTNPSEVGMSPTVSVSHYHDLSAKYCSTSDPRQEVDTIILSSKLQDESTSCTDNSLDFTDVSLTDISEIPPVYETSASPVIGSSGKKSTPVENFRKDSFFDLTVTAHVKSDQSVINISNISAIEPAAPDANASVDTLELATPEIVKKCGGKKRLIADKYQTTLNETLLSDHDTTADSSELDSELCRNIKQAACIFAGLNDTETSVCSESEDSKITDKQTSSSGRKFTVSENKLCRKPCDMKCEVEGHVGKSDCSHNDVTPVSSQQSNEDSCHSMSTEYEYTLNSPPPLQIDLSALEKLSPHKSLMVVKVSADSEIGYEPSDDVLDLDEHVSIKMKYAECPRPLKQLSIESLGSVRSQIYKKLLPEDDGNSSAKYLSVPLTIDVTTTDVDLHNVPTHLQTVASESYGKTVISGLKDLCYSPDLTCKEILDSASDTSTLPSTKCLQCWSPDLTDHDISHDLNERCESRDKLYTNRKAQKRPRKLVFESGDDGSDVYSPTPKLPKTYQRERLFQFPDVAMLDYSSYLKLNSQKSEKLISLSEGDNSSNSAVLDYQTSCAITDTNCQTNSPMSDIEYKTSSTMSDTEYQTSCTIADYQTNSALPDTEYQTECAMPDILDQTSSASSDTEYQTASAMPDTEYQSSLNSAEAYVDQTHCWSSSSAESESSALSVGMQGTLPVRIQDFSDINLPSNSSSLSSSFSENQTEAIQASSECYPYRENISATCAVGNHGDTCSMTTVASMPFSCPVSELELLAQATMSHESQYIYCVSPQPLDLSSHPEQVMSNDRFVPTTTHPESLYVTAYTSEPHVAVLENNYSGVWKEVAIGNLSYSYQPSIQSTQYAMNCYNNAVFGSEKQKWPWNGPEYIARPLTDVPTVQQKGLNDNGELQSNQSTSVPLYSNTSKENLPASVIPSIQGLTVPQMSYPQITESPVPAVLGITLPLQINGNYAENSNNAYNEEQLVDSSKLCNGPLINRQTREVSVNVGEHSQSDVLPNEYNCVHYTAPNDSQSSSSDSDSNPSLMKMVEKKFKNKLKKKCYVKTEVRDSVPFQLSERLKEVRPYVISGWISSTYLMALARKDDLINDMFDSALDERGEVRQWVIENCRSPTPAVLARDLVFRLFTVGELENLNLNHLVRKKRFKAIRRCVEKMFPAKITRSGWEKCLSLIKSSVSTLFRHRIKLIQNFLSVHAGL